MNDAPAGRKSKLKRLRGESLVAGPVPNHVQPDGVDAGCMAATTTPSMEVVSLKVGGFQNYQNIIRYCINLNRKLTIDSGDLFEFGGFHDFVLTQDLSPKYISILK